MDAFYFPALRSGTFHRSGRKVATSLALVGKIHDSFAVEQFQLNEFQRFSLFHGSGMRQVQARPPDI